MHELPPIHEKIKMPAMDIPCKCLSSTKYCDANVLMDTL
jgi:hypothetical protein